MKMKYHLERLDGEVLVVVVVVPMNPGVLIYSPPPFRGAHLAGRISSGHDVAGTLQALA